MLLHKNSIIDFFVFQILRHLQKLWDEIYVKVLFLISSSIIHIMNERIFLISFATTIVRWGRTAHSVRWSTVLQSPSWLNFLILPPYVDNTTVHLLYWNLYWLDLFWYIFYFCCYFYLFFSGIFSYWYQFSLWNIHHISYKVVH